MNGTPGFFINGIFINGAKPADAFSQVIDDGLRRKRTHPTASVSLAC